jgi:hypothetical protein
MWYYTHISQNTHTFSLSQTRTHTHTQVYDVSKQDRVAAIQSGAVVFPAVASLQLAGVPGGISRVECIVVCCGGV